MGRHTWRHAHRPHGGAPLRLSPSRFHTLSPNCCQRVALHAVPHGMPNTAWMAPVWSGSPCHSGDSCTGAPLQGQMGTRVTCSPCSLLMEMHHLWWDCAEKWRFVAEKAFCQTASLCSLQLCPFPHSGLMSAFGKRRTGIIWCPHFCCAGCTYCHFGWDASGGFEFK